MESNHHDTLALVFAFAEAYCIDTMKYYHQLVEQNAHHPEARQKFQSWAMAKHDDLIAVTELREALMGRA